MIGYPVSYGEKMCTSFVNSINCYSQFCGVKYVSDGFLVGKAFVSAAGSVLLP